jgi:hypothetical protein
MRLCRNFHFILSFPTLLIAFVVALSAFCAASPSFAQLRAPKNPQISGHEFTQADNEAMTKQNCVLFIEGFDRDGKHVQIHGVPFEGQAGVSKTQDLNECLEFCEKNFRHQTRPESVYVSSAHKYSTSELKGSCLLKNKKIGQSQSFRL